MTLTSGAETSRTRTELRIVEAARSLLASGGAEACSMRAVGERAGVTAAAIYRHFRDKQALIDHLVARAYENFELALLRAIAPLPVGSFERLAALGEAYLAFATENPEEFKILFTPLPGKRKRLRDLPADGGYPILRQCAVEAIREGTVRDGDADLISLFLWSRVHGLVMLLMACDFEGDIDLAGELTPASLFRQTRDLVLEGLAPRD